LRVLRTDSSAPAHVWLRQGSEQLEDKKTIWVNYLIDKQSCQCLIKLIMILYL
jgi:hypothetical protein